MVKVKKSISEFVGSRKNVSHIVCIPVHDVIFFQKIFPILVFPTLAFGQFWTHEAQQNMIIDFYLRTLYPRLVFTILSQPGPTI